MRVPDPPAGFSRRSLLRIATGGFIVALSGGATTFMSGCGSGSGTAPAPGLPLASSGGTSSGSGTLERPVAAGTFRAQLDQHASALNEMVFALRLPTESIHSSLDLLEAVGALDGGASRATRQTDSSTPNSAQSVGRLMNANSAFIDQTVQRAMQALVQLDTTGYLAASITRQFGLSGGTSLTNPQWDLAFAERLLAIIRVGTATLRGCQIYGTQDQADRIIAEPDLTTKALDYSSFALFFNDWVTGACRIVNLPVPPGALLSFDIAADEINAQLANIYQRMALVPLGFGYRGAAGKATRDDPPAQAPTNADVVENLKQNNFNNTLGDIGAAIRNDTSLISSSSGTIGGRLGLKTEVLSAFTKVGERTLEKGGGLTQTAVSLTSDLINKSLLGYGDPTNAKVGNFLKCGVDITLGALNVAQAVAGFAEETTLAIGAFTAVSGLATPVAGVFAALPFVGGATFEAGLIALNGKGFYDTLKGCLPNPDDVLPDDAAIITKKAPAGNGRNVPATNPAGLECDQLSSASLSPGIARGASGGGRASGNGRNNADFNVEQITPAQARLVLAGSAATGPFARTYENVINAAVALILDFARRSPQLTQPQVSGNSVIYIRSDYGLLVARNSNPASVTPPNIPDALLLCTGVGQLPKRNVDPMDLNALTAWPELTAATAGTGVTANVQ